MADAFVGVAQAFGVQDACVIEHDGILKRSAEGVARAPELVDVADAAEGPGAADIAAKAAGVEVEGVSLSAD